MNKHGINFNRPALDAAQQTLRRRSLRMGLGASYLTLMAVIAAFLIVQQFLIQRALLVAQSSLGSLRGLESLSYEVRNANPAFLDIVQQTSAPEHRWTPRLSRLAGLLPDNAWIVQLDAGNSSTALGDVRRRRMTVNVSAQVHNEEDKIKFPMEVVQILQQDSLFASGYKDIRFASTRILNGTEATVVNFNVECQ